MAKWSEERKQAARDHKTAVVEAIRKRRTEWEGPWSVGIKTEGEIYIADPFGTWAQKKAPLTDDERKAINGEVG